MLLAELNQVSQLLRAEPGVEKLNIGALGNIVRQLHVHLVGRHAGDPAWPTVRPPLVELSEPQRAALVEALGAIGFAMPGLAETAYGGARQ